MSTGFGSSLVWLSVPCVWGECSKGSCWCAWCTHRQQDQVTRQNRPQIFFPSPDAVELFVVGNSQFALRHDLHHRPHHQGGVLAVGGLTWVDWVQEVRGGSDGGGSDVLCCTAPGLQACLCIQHPRQPPPPFTQQQQQPTRQHDRVGPIKHRVGHISHLSARGVGVLNHRLHHLGGADDHLPGQLLGLGWGTVGVGVEVGLGLG